MTSRERRRILVVNDPHGMRISAELAAEIGLPESLILLQLEFLISISNNEREGRYWTYQTLSELQERYFKFWSISTLSRAIKRLVELDLLIVGNFNRVGFDRTQWFAINEVGVERLSSIGLATSILQNEKREPEENPKPEEPLQDATPILQDEKWVLQDETTIPEITSKITQRKNVPDETKKDDSETPPVADLDRYREMTPEERLAQFEANQAQMKRLPRLS